MGEGDIGHGMLPSLRRRLLRGLGAQGLSQGVTLVIHMAEVPLLLGFWGAQLYGEWLMLAAIPAYLAIADGGFIDVAGRAMAMRSAAGDRAGSLALFQSTWLLLLAISAAVGMLSLSLAGWASPASWLGFAALGDEPARLVLLLLIGRLLMVFQGNLVHVGYWCASRYPLATALATLAPILEFLALAAAVAAGGGPVAAATALLGGRLVGLAIPWRMLYRTVPWLRHGRRHASPAELRRIALPAFAGLAFPLGNALNIQGLRLAIGMLLGPAAVAVFVPLRTLSRLAQQPRVMIVHMLQPEMAAAFGRGDAELFRWLLVRCGRFTLWGAVAAALLLALFGGWLFDLWTAGRVPMEWALLAPLLLAALPDSLWNTALNVTYATNRHTRVAVVYVAVYGLGGLLAGYLAASAAGLAGVGLSVVVVEVVMAALVIPGALRLAGQPGGAWLRQVVVPPWGLAATLIATLRPTRIGS